MASNNTVNANHVNSHDLNVTNNTNLTSVSTYNGALGNLGQYEPLPSSGTLNANTTYTVPAAAATVILPSNPQKGDTVKFLWIADTAGNFDIVIKSSGTADTAPFYSGTSTVYIGKVGGGTDAATFTIVGAPLFSDDEIFTIDNVNANQCSGVGSRLIATYMGGPGNVDGPAFYGWHLHGYITLGGDATAVPTGAFSS